MKSLLKFLLSEETLFAIAREALEKLSAEKQFKLKSILLEISEKIQKLYA